MALTSAWETGNMNSTCSVEDMITEAKQKYDYVRFTCADLNGMARSRTVTAAGLDKFFRDGVEVSAGTLTMNTRTLFGPGIERFSRLLESNWANAFLLPVPGTLHGATSGSKDARVGEVLCESHWTDGSVMDADPRSVARKQIQRLGDLGFRLYSSFETEVLIVNKDDRSPIFTRNSCFVNWALMEHEPLLFDIEKSLQNMGVVIESLQVEFDKGQFELCPYPVFDLKAADDAFVMKEGVKEVCLKNGKMATFMSVPSLENTCVTGSHFNHSLWTLDGKTNVFSDASGEHKLSDVARHWLGGVTRHAPALTALCNPTVNCYRRIHNHGTPQKGDWGIDHRVACFRVKNYCPRRTYIESRLPGGSSNPYIVLAATLAAGMDGITNKLECPKQCRQVTAEDITKLIAEMSGKGEEKETQNLVPNGSVEAVCRPESCKESDMADEKDKGAMETDAEASKEEEVECDPMQPTIPFTLEEALEALQRDTVIVQALGHEFIEWFVNLKRMEFDNGLDRWKENKDKPEMFQAELDWYFDYL